MSQIDDTFFALCKSARHIVVLTGAGISAESGIPTFREAQTGLWAQYDPQELATPEAFRRNPKLVWEWYQWRNDLVSNAEPNPGHLALAELEQWAPQFTLITQNVDGLHAAAGSQNVLELHGRINRYKCAAGDGVVSEWEDDSIPPKCPKCGGYLRPDVVWFGETLPYEAIEQAVVATQQCDLFFSIGTSSLVHPAASLPLLALEQNVPVVEVNPNPTPLTQQALYVFQEPAAHFLPRLMGKLR